MRDDARCMWLPCQLFLLHTVWFPFIALSGTAKHVALRHPLEWR